MEIALKSFQCGCYICKIAKISLPTKTMKIIDCATQTKIKGAKPHIRLLDAFASWTRYDGHFHTWFQPKVFPLKSFSWLCSRSSWRRFYLYRLAVHSLHVVYGTNEEREKIKSFLMEGENSLNKFVGSMECGRTSSFILHWKWINTGDCGHFTAVKQLRSTQNLDGRNEN